LDPSDIDLELKEIDPSNYTDTRQGVVRRNPGQTNYLIQNDEDNLNAGSDEGMSAANNTFSPDIDNNSDESLLSAKKKAKDKSLPVCYSMRRYLGCTVSRERRQIRLNG